MQWSLLKHIENMQFVPIHKSYSSLIDPFDILRQSHKIATFYDRNFLTHLDLHQHVLVRYINNQKLRVRHKDNLRDFGDIKLDLETVVQHI